MISTSTLKKIAIIMLALLGTAACGESDTSRSLGTVDANGVGVDGSVPAGARRIYTLRGIMEHSAYTVRTTVTDTNLAMAIYRSESAYKADVSDVVATAAPAFVSVASYQTTTYFEARFTAAAGASGDYVAVLSAPMDSAQRDLFFYDLRLISPSVLTVLSLPTTTAVISPGQLQIFDGGSVVSPGTYSITLQSSSSTTANCPQFFVYKDSTLSLQNSLLRSVVTDTSGNLAVFDFQNGIGEKQSGNVNAILTTGATITTTGPFIMMKGAASAVEYYLKVSQ